MFSRYNHLVIPLIALPLLVVLCVALTMEPISGDLTRIGGYSESRFGWKDPQEGFLQNQFRIADSLDDYDRYYDVVVLGDSFSVDRSKGWQNYFVEHTGMSLITFYMARGFQLEQIVNSKQYREKPPKIFIYESVERMSFIRFHEFAGKDWPIVATTKPASLSDAEISPAEKPKKEIVRKRHVSLEQGFSEAVSYITKAGNRLIGKDNGKALVYPLERKGMFSSNDDSHLLVVVEDTAKDFSAPSVKRAVTGLQKARSLVEANGRTRFSLLLFPDKLTTYSPFLLDKNMLVKSYIPALSEDFPFVRLDEVFREKIQQGIKDVYLPNDTHTGYYGHKTAALNLAKHIFK